MNGTIPDKLYFKIGEVASLTEVKPHVLRYWESEFKMISPRKSKTNQRVYSRGDVELIVEIRRLLYDEKFTLEGAKKRVREFQAERARQMKLPFSDKNIQKKLVAMKRELKSIREILS